MVDTLNKDIGKEPFRFKEPRDIPVNCPSKHSTPYQGAQKSPAYLDPAGKLRSDDIDEGGVLKLVGSGPHFQPTKGICPYKYKLRVSKKIKT
jgi:hypothetical protein